MRALKSYTTKYLFNRLKKLDSIWSGADKKIFAYTEIEVLNELLERQAI